MELSNLPNEYKIILIKYLAHKHKTFKNYKQKIGERSKQNSLIHNNKICNNTYSKPKYIGCTKLYNIYDYTNKLITVRVIDKDDIKNGYMDVVETFKRSPHEHLPKILNTIGDIHVMQEYYGDLYSYICYKKVLSEDIALNLFKQIVNTVMHCHKDENSIALRDIKAGKFMFTDKNLKHLTLADITCAKKMDKTILSTDKCGTASYIAPELIMKEKYDPFAADIWSLGVLLYLMVVGHFPFDHKDKNILIKMITEGHVIFPDHVSAKLQRLIEKCLMKNPIDRPNAQALFNDINNNDELSISNRLLQLKQQHYRNISLL